MASLVPDLRKFIVGLEIKNAASVSESTWRKIAGMINFLGHRAHQEKVFPINGSVGGLQGFYPINAIDGYAFFEFDAEIFNVWVYNIKGGISGITELDLKVKAKGSPDPFVSIFSTTPKIQPVAGDDVWFELGDSLTGVTTHVLDTIGGAPYQVSRGDAIRLDLLSAMPSSEHCGVVIHFRPR